MSRREPTVRERVQSFLDREDYVELVRSAYEATIDQVNPDLRKDRPGKAVTALMLFLLDRDLRRHIAESDPQAMLQALTSLGLEV